ncbi:hypothetical protein BCT41_11185 [Vibrio splendidus]|nr:hypothetical protein BCT41_11185 [Vibrio splendidus]
MGFFIGTSLYLIRYKQYLAIPFKQWIYSFYDMRVLLSGFRKAGAPILDKEVVDKETVDPEASENQA